MAPAAQRSAGHKSENRSHNRRDPLAPAPAIAKDSKPVPRDSHPPPRRAPAPRAESLPDPVGLEDMPEVLGLPGFDAPGVFRVWHTAHIAAPYLEHQAYVLDLCDRARGYYPRWCKYLVRDVPLM